MTNKEKKDCDFSSDKRCVWIDGKQYVSLDRFLEVKNQNDNILKDLQKRCSELEADNKIFKETIKRLALGGLDADE